MDISRYNMPPVRAAMSRMILAQRTQRAVGMELLALDEKTAGKTWSPFRGGLDLATLHKMQRQAYHNMCEARQQLEWLTENNIHDVAMTDEASLVAGAEQRARVERQYDEHRRR